MLVSNILHHHTTVSCGGPEPVQFKRCLKIWFTIFLSGIHGGNYFYFVYFLFTFLMLSDVVFWCGLLQVYFGLLSGDNSQWNGCVWQDTGQGEYRCCSGCFLLLLIAATFFPFISLQFNFCACFIFFLSIKFTLSRLCLLFNLFCFYFKW